MSRSAEYCCVATSFRAWAQQVAVSYVQRGYHRYVDFWIPKHKDPVLIDRKLIAKYHIGISDSARSWRKRNGLARFQYIRHGRFGLILIAEGRQDGFPPTVVMPHQTLKDLLAQYGQDLYRSSHTPTPNGQVVIDFEKEEGKRMKHLYREAICYGGYEIRYRNGRASVRIDGRYYEALRTRFLSLAKHPDTRHLQEAFRELRFQPFAPLRSQLWKLIDEVNAYRKSQRIEDKKVEYEVAGPCLRRQTGRLVLPPGMDVRRDCFGDGPQPSNEPMGTAA